MTVDYIPTPDKFELSPAYPNPFNPSTTVQYALPTSSDLTLSVYDIRGRLMTYLARGLVSSGYYEEVWDASQYSSGIYFIRLQAYGIDGKNNFVSTQKIVLVK